MTRTLPGRAEPAVQSQHPVSQTDRLRVGCDGLLDLTVISLATWTLVYHLCLVLHLGVPWAVALEVVALAGALWLRSRYGHRGESRDVRRDEPQPPAVPPRRRWLLVVAVPAVLGAALLVAFDTGWTLVALLWLLAAGAATAWAATGPMRTAPAAPAASPQLEARVALGWAVALALLASVSLRPSPDDLYYVNLAQWVADHGTYPLRDTIFSDLAFPMSSWPPVGSYDALVGTVARLAGVHAAAVAYLLVPPLVTFMSVLALWRLLRAWQVRAGIVALSLALVFLLFDGSEDYLSPGNLFLTRLWQGKVILLCLLVPTLLVYALRYVERPTRERALWLVAGGVAATGLSTTAMFLVPLLAVGGVAPLVVARRPRQALQGFFTLAGYPLLAGAVTVAIGGHSADFFGQRKLYRFDPSWFGNTVLHVGPVALLAVSAVLLGAILVPHAAARITTGVLATIVGVTLVPQFTHVTFDVLGLGPTLWRVSWLATVAALVGVLGVWLSRRAARWVPSLLVPLTIVATLALFGTPINSADSGAFWKTPWHWQRGDTSLDIAPAAVAAVRPGSVILAPTDLSITITVLTTEAKTVAPRAYFMDYLRDDPAFHYPERRTLTRWATFLAKSDGVARSLRVLGVDEVCLPSEASSRIRFAQAHGYHSGPSTSSYRCLVHRGESAASA